MTELLVAIGIGVLWLLGRRSAPPGGGGGSSTAGAGEPASSGGSVASPGWSGCVSILAGNGKYVAAELGSSYPVLTATRAAVGSWERFRVVPQSDGSVALQAANGRFVTAELGGGRHLQADWEDSSHSWRHYFLRDAGNGLIAIETANGSYVQIVPGEANLSATASGIGPASSFKLSGVGCPENPNQPTGGGDVPPDEHTTDEPPPNEGIDVGEPGAYPSSDAPNWTRAGTVESDRGTLIVNGSARLALGATFFPLAWAFQNDRGRLGDNLGWLRERGVDYIRALAVVGPGQGWEDRTVTPDADHAGATDFAASLGLRVQWTIFGNLDQVPTRQDRRTVVENLIAMSANRESKLFVWEVANEAAGTGWLDVGSIAELRELATMLRTETPLLTALSAAPSESQTADWYRNSSADLLTVHLDRSRSGTCGDWRPVRQPWEVQFVPDVPGTWLNNEPIGPQSSVEADDDPWRLTMAAAVSWLCGLGGYTLHAGPGIRFGGAADLARGRSANFWDVPNLESALQGISLSRDLLPADLPSWNRQNSHWAGYPFESDQVQPIIDSDGLCRAYAATGGNRFVMMPIQIQTSVPFVARQPMHLQAFYPNTGALYADMMLERGGTFLAQPDVPALIVTGELF